MEWSKVTEDSNMPILVDKTTSAGTTYYTADNHTLRIKKVAAMKNSPYYKKKKARMEVTSIKMEDPEAIREALATGDPQAYADAIHVKTAEEKAAAFEQAYAEAHHLDGVGGAEATNNLVSANEPAKGVFDGTIAVRVNNRLPTSGNRWIMDPTVRQLTIAVTSVVRGLGGKATGAIVIGSTKAAMSVVVFGTYGVDDIEEKKQLVIQTADWIVDSDIPIRYQIMHDVPTRATAFSRYEPTKAKLYGTVHYALEAVKDLTEEKSDEKPKAETDEDWLKAWLAALKRRILLDKARNYISEHPRRVAVGVAAAIAAVGTVIWSRVSNTKLPKL